MRRGNFRGPSRNRNGRGRGGEGRGGEGRGGGGGNRRFGGRRNNRRTNPRQSAESGNRRERIAVESGFLVLIDQFMLANQQFIDRFSEIIDADAAEKDKLIQDYGGRVIEVHPETYRIERDPYAYNIIIYPESGSVDPETISQLATKSQGNIFVDTRCLAMIDRELLDDSSLLEKYNQLWFSGQDKACRDLLRDNGGAVRYGFQRYGDDLGIFTVPDEDIVALWPMTKPEGSA